MDYEALADAGITFDEVRDVLKDGYPRFVHLRPLLEKAEKLGYIGDVMSHAYGKETKVEEILIKELKPLIKKEVVAEKREVEKPTTIETTEEEEEAEVML